MSAKIWFAFVGVVALFVGVAIWDARTCAEYGPSEWTFIQGSCGDGCITITPVETRRCIRRKQ